MSMVRSRSNIRPLVLAAVAEGRPIERPPRRTPAVILAFPGSRVAEAPPPRPRARPSLRARLALMLVGALTGLAIAGCFALL
jgi:hypothetical protein